MSRRNRILISTEPKGRFCEGVGTTGETYYPGMVVQRDPTASMQNGRPVFKLYNRDADGNRPAGAHWIVLEDYLQGKTVSDSLSGINGDRLFLYAPLPGDELNLLYENVAGTADDVAAGDLLIVNDGTGKFIVTTGSPECEPAMALEAVTDPTADTLVYCEWTGH